MIRVGIVGDFDPSSPTHRALDESLRHAAVPLGLRLDAPWIPTLECSGDATARLSAFGALLAAPGSPYRDFDGMLNAIRFAREARKPFLGVCGGFQHAVVEYARHVIGIPEADHEETSPDGTRLVITKLPCSLRGRSERVLFREGSRLSGMYGAPSAEERYFCSFGVHPGVVPALEAGGLVVSASGEGGAPRAVELPSHPFFIATLFQPPLSSVPERPHPLILGFLRSCHAGLEGRA